MFLKPGGMGLVLCTLIVVATPLCADDAAIRKDQKTLEGVWTYKNETGSEVVYRFKGNKLEITAPSRSYKMTMKLTLPPVLRRRSTSRSTTVPTRPGARHRRLSTI